MEDHSFLSQAWAIEPSALQHLSCFDRSQVDMAALESRVNLSELEEKIEMVGDSTAVISIHGPMMPDAGVFEKVVMGATDTNRLTELVRIAGDDDSIKEVIFDIDSPGGMVTGTPELGDAVREVSEKKSTKAFTRGMMASAAYWVGSQAGEVAVTGSSNSGSVGVIAPHVDLTEARAKEGIKITLFTDGKFKAAGAYNTTLTEEQAQHKQEQVEAIGENFRETVTSARPAVARESMEGQVFRGGEAVERGMADRLVSGFADILTLNHKPMGRHAEAASVDSRDVLMSTEASNTDGAQSAEEAATPEAEVAQDLPVAEDQNAEDVASEAVAEETAEEQSATEEAATEEVATEEAATEDHQTPADDFAAELAALRSEIAGLRESLAKAETDDEAASAEAANIAASAGVDPVQVSNGEVNDDSRLKAMSNEQLWAEYRSIESAEEKRAFYEDNIRSRRS